MKKREAPYAFHVFCREFPDQWRDSDEDLPAGIDATLRLIPRGEVAAFATYIDKVLAEMSSAEIKGLFNRYMPYEVPLVRAKEAKGFVEQIRDRLGAR